jgi:butyrate kinase
MSLFSREPLSTLRFLPAGENELEALAFGALRVLRGEEDFRVFNG